MKDGDLTPRQAAFVREYLLDGNGTQAAIRAGYSKNTANEQASRLLTKNNIQEKVAAGRAKIAEQVESSAERIRRRLWEEADDFTEMASHSARIKALETLAKLDGLFAKDNGQKNPPIPAVLKVAFRSVESDEADDDGDD